ncbi:MAG: hypothetical protein HYV63_24960 [Candidatus Schekmanbacteria bacterium]|nr:hypothetical protein [Candidatus Schekmanbacteria bacterium]
MTGSLDSSQGRPARCRPGRTLAAALSLAAALVIALTSPTPASPAAPSRYQRARIADLGVRPPAPAADVLVSPGDAMPAPDSSIVQYGLLRLRLPGDKLALVSKTMIGKARIALGDGQLVRITPALVAQYSERSRRPSTH